MKSRIKRIEYSLDPRILLVKKDEIEKAIIVRINPKMIMAFTIVEKIIFLADSSFVFK